MELSKEIIESHKLTEDQVKAVTEYGKSVIASEKGKIEEEWKTKAHTDAQGILSGAATSIEKLTGIKRKDAEKIAEYIERSANEYTNTQKSELEKLKNDYEEKIKGVKDAGALKDEYEKMKLSQDAILKKYADYDSVKEKAQQAGEYEKQLSELKLEVAFAKAKPSFPDTVNPYESKAKWDEFTKKLLEKNTIELVDGEPIVVDKENKYKQEKLVDVVAKDEAIQGLLKGRQQTGIGAKPVDKKTIEGVPFEVPVNADTKTIGQTIRDYLAKQNVALTSTEYPVLFSKYMTAIQQQKA